MTTTALMVVIVAVLALLVWCFVVLARHSKKMDEETAEIWRRYRKDRDDHEKWLIAHGRRLEREGK